MVDADALRALIRTWRDRHSADCAHDADARSACADELEDVLDAPYPWANGPVLSVPVLAGVSFVPPPPNPETERIGAKLAQLVTAIGLERARRLEAAVVERIQRGQRVEEVRIHRDAGNIEQRAEFIVAGKVAATVDLSDLAPAHLLRDPGKPPA